MIFILSTPINLPPKLGCGYSDFNKCSHVCLSIREQKLHVGNHMNSCGKNGFTDVRACITQGSGAYYPAANFLHIHFLCDWSLQLISFSVNVILYKVTEPKLLHFKITGCKRSSSNNKYKKKQTISLKVPRHILKICPHKYYLSTRL